jgi:hypothetical protein
VQYKGTGFVYQPAGLFLLYLKKLRDYMIDWEVKLKNNKKIKDNNWFFINFEIQEYLLPIINVGFSMIDEYNDTKFSIEDCRRLIGNIGYMMDSGLLNNKERIKYDSYGKGLIELKTDEIIDCLATLKKAAKISIENDGILIFLGD